MVVGIQRFKLCFLFILHLDGCDQRGQNKLPFVVDERACLLYTSDAADE